MIAIIRAAFLLLLSASLAACGSSEREIDRSAREGILLVGNGVEPQTLDPHVAVGSPEFAIMGTLLEGLVRSNPEDAMNPLPGVAESWEHNEDYTRWIFHLRDDARWSDGDPVTAKDFVYSWRRALTPALGSENAEALYLVKNAERFNKGEIADPDQLGVHALDEHTLDVELEAPSPYFLFQLDGFVYLPVKQDVVEKFADMASRQNAWSNAGNFVGNGPFVLTDWQTNQLIDVKKNPQYWDAGSIKLEGIRFLPIENAKTEENSFFDGRLHLTSTIAPDRFEYLRDTRPQVVQSLPSLRNYFYYLNITRKPLDDLRVRKALSLALDRELLVSRVTKSGEVAAGGLSPPGFADFTASNSLAFDPEEARRLLAEAGYPGGQGFPKLEILINTSEAHRKIAEAIQEMWRQNLGVEIGIYNQEWKVYLDNLTGGHFDMARAGLNIGNPDAYDFLRAFETGGNRNFSGWSSAEFDSLLGQAQLEGDPARRNALLQRADQIINDDLPVIPIYWPRRNFLMQEMVKGYTPTLLSFSFNPVSLDP